MFPEWTWIVGFIIGASIGSFLNVVIYRMPRRLSLAKPANSFCPNCGTTLGARDLIPLLSWLIARGKCRYCFEKNGVETKIASRYFWVELITGAIWAAIWWQYFIVPMDKWVTGICFSLASAAAVALTFIDFEFFEIPDEINAFLLVDGIVLGFLTHNVKGALIGAFVGWALLWGCAFLARVAFGKDGMGHGDIKLMRGMGALIGALLTATSLAIAVIVGLIFGIIGIIVESKKKKSVSVDAATAEAEQEDWEPESIPHLLKMGLFYLLCGDIFAIFVPKIYTMMGEPIDDAPAGEDGWEPTMTTIPFGPYLAIGCLVCMLFGEKIEGALKEYWRSRTGEVSFTRPSTLSQPGKTVYRMTGRRVFDSRDEQAGG